MATSPTTSSPKNQPLASSYIKPHKNFTFSFANESNSFQQGVLGDSDSYLEGNLHLRYTKPKLIRSVTLDFKGFEKTSWYKAQARTKAVYSGDQILAEKSEVIWDNSREQSVTELDIPFKIFLPYNLPETVVTEIGQVNYILRATVNQKGSIITSSSQIVEIQCPLKRTLMLDTTNVSTFKLRGESRSGIDYTFTLPPNKNFNLGTYVSIPMRIRFLRPGVSVERIEIALKTCMDFRCSNPNETRHLKETSATLIVPRQEIVYLQSNSPHYEGECIHTINLFVPRSVQPTYSGRFISITHQFCIKFCLWGADKDFQVEENVYQRHHLQIRCWKLYHHFLMMESYLMANIYHQHQQQLLYQNKSPIYIAPKSPPMTPTPPLSMVNMYKEMLPGSTTPTSSAASINSTTATDRSSSQNSSKLPPYERSHLMTLERSITPTTSTTI
ncbi:6284_t:CDS:2 [Diversispora eburnea]|uniref:6284_t:CDS:1 n=1 Tax=Diversispora eburnea TaxID=1213867 RepID=A0A9N8YMC8_9GLOM|nr:6284_t:CDS:2 [Diversispora eburnea]